MSQTYQFSSRDLFARLDPADKLPRYFELLAKENQRINLVSRETIAGSAAGQPGLVLLAAESLAPLAILSVDAFPAYLDIGSGGGFPSIPILLSGRVGEGVLVERTQKKAAALRRMSLGLGIHSEIEPVSFEQAGLGERRFNLITIRLVKLDRTLLTRCFDLLAPSGVILYYSVPELTMDDFKADVSTFRYTIDAHPQVHSVTAFIRNL